MRTVLTLLVSLFVTIAIAQNNMFVHTATAANISGDGSRIDHPLLNDNPTAKIIVTHNWNPPGSIGVYNNEITGVFYNMVPKRWAVYNESGAPMIPGSSYNIFINDEAITLHIASLANQGSSDSFSVTNHPDLNNNPNAHLTLTTYFNPNGLRNDNNYGVWYDSTAGKWNIYSENDATIPEGAAFFVANQETQAAHYKHTANAGNTIGHITTIDHPLLNNNHDAVFVIGHNWGVSGSGSPSNVIFDVTMGVWYDGTNWAIYSEDLTPLPLGIEYDLMILDPTLSTEDKTIEGLNYYPNPVSDYINISANSSIDNVTVFDILGREVWQQDGDQHTMKLNLASLTSGNYLAQVTSENTVQVIKLIKE